LRPPAIREMPPAEAKMQAACRLYESIRVAGGSPTWLLSPTGLMGRAEPDIRYGRFSDIHAAQFGVSFHSLFGHQRVAH
jgi:hypothetical protein